MDSTGVVILFAALAASAFFSGIEIAFLSANRLKIELDKQKGLLSGKILSRFVKHDNRFIATMLLGNSISLVIYGIWMAKLIEPAIAAWISSNEAVVLLLQTFFSTLIFVVTSEFLLIATFQIISKVTTLISVEKKVCKSKSTASLLLIHAYYRCYL